jgi:single-strand DNA-binding protein
MINHVILVGNTGNDAEIVSFEGGSKIARVSLATTQSWKDKQSGEKKEKTTWHNLQFNGPIVDVVEKYIKKGDRIYIEGSIDNYSYQDKDNQTRYSSRISCNKLKMLSSKNDSAPSSVPSQEPIPENPPTQDADPNDDLPF